MEEEENDEEKNEEDKNEEDKNEEDKKEEEDEEELTEDKEVLVSDLSSRRLQRRVDDYRRTKKRLETCKEKRIGCELSNEGCTERKMEKTQQDEKILDVDAGDD